MQMLIDRRGSSGGGRIERSSKFAVTFISDCTRTSPGLSRPRAENFHRVIIIACTPRILFFNLHERLSSDFHRFQRAFQRFDFELVSPAIPRQRFQRLIAGNRISSPYNTQPRSIVTCRGETVRATWRFIVPSFPLKHLG